MHQDKGWPKMTNYLDREVTVQEIRQVGFSSAGNDEYDNNFQAGL